MPNLRKFISLRMSDLEKIFALGALTAKAVESQWLTLS